MAVQTAMNGCHGRAFRRRDRLQERRRVDVRDRIGPVRAHVRIRQRREPVAVGVLAGAPQPAERLAEDHDREPDDRTRRQSHDLVSTTPRSGLGSDPQRRSDRDRVRGDGSVDRQVGLIPGASASWVGRPDCTAGPRSSRSVPYDGNVPNLALPCRCPAPPCGRGGSGAAQARSDPEIIEAAGLRWIHIESPRSRPRLARGPLPTSTRSTTRTSTRATSAPSSTSTTTTSSSSCTSRCTTRTLTAS